MTNIAASEHELATFLEHQQRDMLSTWRRDRTRDELIGFIERRFAQLEDA